MRRSSSLRGGGISGSRRHLPPTKQTRLQNGSGFVGVFCKSQRRSRLLAMTKSATPHTFGSASKGLSRNFERRRQLRGGKASAKASSSRRSDLVWRIRNSRHAGPRHRGSKVKWLLAFVVLSAASHAQGAENLPPAECGDFLKRLGLTRPDIVFVGCDKRHM